VIRRYVNQRAANGPTVAFDEFGPLEIRPQHGQSWGRDANRLPATYTRKHGVRHWLAFYDVHGNKLWGYTRPRKRSGEVLGVLKRMRKRYPPDERIHLILDNFSPHGTPAVRSWCAKNNVHLIWTPTNASWLNPIECQFTPVKEFVIRNTVYTSHEELAEALRKYACYRNQHAKRKKS
jgi:transposase